MGGVGVGARLLPPGARSERRAEDHLAVPRQHLVDAVGVERAVVVVAARAAALEVDQQAVTAAAAIDQQPGASLLPGMVWPG